MNFTLVNIHLVILLYLKFTCATILFVGSSLLCECFQIKRGLVENRIFFQLHSLLIGISILLLISFQFSYCKEMVRNYSILVVYSYRPTVVFVYLLTNSIFARKQKTKLLISELHTSYQFTRIHDYILQCLWCISLGREM